MNPEEILKWEVVIAVGLIIVGCIYLVIKDFLVDLSWKIYMHVKGDK